MRFDKILVHPYLRDLIKRCLTEEEQEKFFLLELTESLNDIGHLEKFLKNNQGQTPLKDNDYCPAQISFLLGFNRVQIDYSPNSVFDRFENNIYYFKNQQGNEVDYPKKISGIHSISGANILKDKEEFNHFVNLLNLTFTDSKIDINER